MGLVPCSSTSVRYCCAVGQACLGKRSGLTVLGDDETAPITCAGDDVIATGADPSPAVPKGFVQRLVDQAGFVDTERSPPSTQALVAVPGPTVSGYSFCDQGAFVDPPQDASVEVRRLRIGGPSLGLSWGCACGGVLNR